MDSDDSDGSGNVIVVDIDRVAMDWDEELSGTSEVRGEFPRNFKFSIIYPF